LNITRNEVEVRSEVDNIILERLQELEQKEGQLPDTVEYYRELLQIQARAKSHIVVRKPSLGRDLVYDRLREGIPLLLFRDFRPDWEQVQAVFEQVAVWAAKDSQNPPGESKRLRKIGRKGHSLGDIATAEGVDEVMLTSAIAVTLKPFLFVYSSLLLPDVDQDLWRRRYCPVCGGKPDFAYLDKERGARWLLCSRCDAEWLFLRLVCPYCGTQNQDALAYFTDEEESYLYRLYICEQCRTYIKAVDLRRSEADILLSLERMMTLDMDRQAQEKGYKCGWTNLVV